MHDKRKEGPDECCAAAGGNATVTTFAKVKSSYNCGVHARRRHADSGNEISHSRSQLQHINAQLIDVSCSWRCFARDLCRFNHTFVSLIDTPGRRRDFRVHDAPQLQQLPLSANER